MRACEWGLHSVHHEFDSLSKAIVLPCVEQMGFRKWSRSVNQGFVRVVTIKWRASWVAEPFPLPINTCLNLPKQKRVSVELQLSVYNVFWVAFWKQKEHSISLSSIHISADRVLAQLLRILTSCTSCRLWLWSRRSWWRDIYFPLHIF